MKTDHVPLVAHETSVLGSTVGFLALVVVGLTMLVMGTL